MERSTSPIRTRAESRSVSHVLGSCLNALTVKDCRCRWWCGKQITSNGPITGVPTSKRCDAPYGSGTRIVQPDRSTGSHHTMLQEVQRATAEHLALHQLDL